MNVISKTKQVAKRHSRNIIIFVSLIIGIISIVIYYLKVWKKEPPVEIVRNRKYSNKVTVNPCIGDMVYRRDNDICIWGHSNPKPKTDSEIINSSYNEGSLKINGHPFILHKNGNLNIYRHWWSLSNCLYFTRGYSKKPGHYFIQTNQGLYYTSSSSIMKLTNDVYDRMVIYENTPYVIKKGRLYKCPSPMEFITANFRLNMNHWDIDPINFIGGFDIRIVDIVDISCAANDELIITVSSGRVLYIPTSKESDLINRRYLKHVIDRSSIYYNPFGDIKLDLRSNIRNIVTSFNKEEWKKLPINRIILGDTSDTFMIFYNHDISIIHNGNVIMTLNGISYAIFGPAGSNLIYTINLSGVTRVYNYKEGLISGRTILDKMSRVDVADDNILLISQKNIINTL